MTELRAADLRFSPGEAADFLNHVMGLQLAEEDVAALEARTEGWIAGLQLAALHIRASQWYKDNGLTLEAFYHATAANDVDRAVRLMNSPAIGLPLRNVVTTILD